MHPRALNFISRGKILLIKQQLLKKESRMRTYVKSSNFQAIIPGPWRLSWWSAYQAILLVFRV
jgi:hypothetical protein